jgi:hypothetical protein
LSRHVESVRRLGGVHDDFIVVVEHAQEQQ